MTVPSYRVTALERGLKVLSTFTAQRRQLGVSEVARLTGLPVSTVYRLLRTLVDNGYAEQLPDGQFAPSVRVLELGFAALQHDAVVEAARGPLHDLSTRTGETCNLGMLAHTDVLYLIRHRTSHYVIANVFVGSSLPATCTSMGKILLALLPAPQLADVLADVDLATAGVGPNAHRSLAALRLDLDETRDRGWGLQDEEVAHGLRSIAAPVRSADGVVAAVGLSVEGARWSRERMLEEFRDQVLDTARKISVRLGYLEGVRPSR